MPQFFDSQILTILKEPENEVLYPSFAVNMAMNSAILFYKWRAKYGGMDGSLMTRIKELKKAPSEKDVYEAQLKCEIIQEPLTKNGKVISTSWGNPENDVSLMFQ